MDNTGTVAALGALPLGFTVLSFLMDANPIPSEVWGRNTFLRRWLRPGIKRSDLAEGNKPGGEDPDFVPVSRWKSLALFTIGLAETCAFAVIGIKLLSSNKASESERDLGLAFLGAAFADAYTGVTAISRPFQGRAAPKLLIAIQASAALWSIFFALSRATTAQTLADLNGPLLAVASHLASLAVFMTLPVVPFKPRENEAETTGPEDFVSVGSWLSFGWVSSLVNTARTRTLEDSDVWALSPYMQSQTICDRFLKVFQKGHLAKTVVQIQFIDLTVYLSLKTLSSLLSFVTPYMLRHLLDEMTRGGPGSAQRCLVIATIMLLASLCKAESDLFNLWFSRRAGTRARSGLMAAVYHKALTRKDFSGGTKKEDKDENVDEDQAKVASTADVGRIVNLMSSDANTVGNTLMSLDFILMTPIELTIAFTLLYQVLGWSAFAGFIVLVVAVPLNYLLMQLLFKLSKRVSSARDDKMNSVTELITACRTLKYFAWEDTWLEKVAKLRGKELRFVLIESLANLGLDMVWNIVPDAITIISLGAFTKWAGNDLTVAIAFTALALFEQANGPLLSFPYGILALIEANVALTRIQTYLDDPDVAPWVTSFNREGSVSERVGFDRASFRWVGSTEAKASGDEEGEGAVFSLDDLSLDLPPDSLTLITGPTGSGKSSLLQALLGEMDCVAGTVYLPKELAPLDPKTFLYNGTSYVSQNPWLEQASIRNNILFGSPFDSQRYNAVLDACALRADLKILEDGDRTEIGERGVSLSGGQKARVALARAIYSRARVVLLDDPLSAVDMHTARHLYEHLFKGPLLKYRTVVLVTHHTDLTEPVASSVISLYSGSLTIEKRTPEAISRDDPSPPVIEQAETEAAAKQFISTEERKKGSISFSTYNTYIARVGYVMFGLWILFVYGYSFSHLIVQWWVKVWSEAYDRPPTTLLPTSFVPASLARYMPSHRLAYIPIGDNTKVLAQNIISAASPIARVYDNHVPFLDLPPAYENVTPYLIGYLVVGLLKALFDTIAVSIGILTALRASQKLFLEVIAKVVHAPSRWFDTTPLGRTLNRFASDFPTLDISLRRSLSLALQEVAATMVCIGTIIVVVPAFIFPAILIILGYYYLAYGYVMCSRDLRRMMNIYRSPIYANFAETLNGIVTIRAFSAEGRFLSNVFKRIDTYVRCDWYFWMCNRYLLFRFDTLGSFAVYSTIVLCILTTASPGISALAIVNAQSLVGTIYWLCRFYSLLEVNLNSVERIEEMLHIPQEPPAVIESNRPPAVWPSSSGSVVFDDLHIRYAPELPDVVKGISFEISPRHKVGVVGRTGSGKSTMVMSLTRFVDPSKGRIIIDGIDIKTLGLRDLRSRVTVIPQEAVLFSGTVRSNLDPLNEHSDSDIWHVLESVMLTTSSSAPVTPTAESPDQQGLGRISIKDLDMPVSAGGMNFSQGQRQLLSLARALLRNSRIIIMDEATASVDFETDHIIQDTIRTKFADSLVITIAHRLKTIIDYDKVLVLDHGLIAEYDSPKNLLTKPDSQFRSMCETGADWDEIKAHYGI